MFAQRKRFTQIFPHDEPHDEEKNED